MCSLAQGDLTFDPADDSSETQSVTSTDSMSECSNVCKKCRTADASLTLRKKDRYCRPCFITSFNHKFRSTLGKRHVMKHGDRIVVDFDGRQNSVTVAKLIKSSLDEANVKRVVYTPILVIVYDFQSVERISEIIENAKKFGFDIFLVGLHNGLDEDSIEPLRVGQLSSKAADELNPKNEEFQTLSEEEVRERLSDELNSKFGQNLNQIVEAIKEESAKEFFVDNLKEKVLLKAAEILKCSKIFTNECSDNLAVKIISGVATGRGVHLVNDASFQNNRGPVHILRPLKDSSLEEIRLYNENDTFIISEAEFDREDRSTKSIMKLSQSFIFGLQDGFSATIPTICRTGDKLSHDKHSDKLRTCALCSGSIDTLDDGDVCSALDATAFSKQMSLAKNIAEGVSKVEISTTQGCCSTEEPDCHSKKGGGCCQDKNSDIPVELMKRHLCYSCSIVIDKMEQHPKFLIRNVQKKINRDKMENEIKDFLL